MQSLSEEILTVLKQHPQGLPIKDICARVSGTRFAISRMVITLKELGKIDSDGNEEVFQRRWFAVQNP